jgi:hypothetical protein
LKVGPDMSADTGTGLGDVRARKILFVSGYFPPNAPVGAVRTGRLEQHWRNLGHDVRTITIDLPVKSFINQIRRPGAEYVPFTQPRDILAGPARGLRRLRSALAGKVDPAKAPTATADLEGGDTQKPTMSWHAWLKAFYYDMLFFPDRYKSWIRPAVRSGLALRSTWAPHLIYSSGPPHSGHIVAARLASRLGVPWIAELRDLWADNPYDDHLAIARRMQDSLARKTLAQAAACAVVTAMAKTQMDAIVRGPVIVAYNGYDPEDFAGLENVEPFDLQRLTILHAGTIYAGRRDPTPLFQAIQTLGNRAREVRCLFFHDSRKSVASLVRHFALEHCVEIHAQVPRAEMLRLERQVDILLECRWTDPKGDGVIPGKLFEYIGARRPILSIGSTTAEAAQIVRESERGLVSSDPTEIRAMLLASLETKRRLGRLPDTSQSTDARFWRETQYRKIDELIEATLACRVTHMST